MNNIPVPIRRMLRARIDNQQMRDQVVMGYYHPEQTFWLACVDEAGAVDHEFAEPMPPSAYQTLMDLVNARVKKRGGVLTADMVMSALHNRTLQ